MLMGLFFGCHSRLIISFLSVKSVIFLIMMLCGRHSSSQWIDIDLDHTQVSSETYRLTCEALLQEYIEVAGTFTHCELSNAKPYRICTQCFKTYAIMKSLYNYLVAEPKLHDCMVKFLKSDRVQIIPTVQKTADDLWRTSDCTSCISHLHADAKTKAINYTVPEKVHQFFILYSNMSECLGKNATFEITGILQNKSDEGNVSALCKMCHNKYNKLNDHYNSLAKDVKGEVCMDIVDMMNYTRIAWSDNLNCSHRSADAAVVIVITLFIAISPLCFYLPLRYTSKEKIKQVLKQKRLDPNPEGFLTSASASFASRDGTPASSTSLSQVAS